jgi:murein L,D-transpeptidase YcbB/YkuD
MKMPKNHSLFVVVSFFFFSCSSLENKAQVADTSIQITAGESEAPGSFIVNSGVKFDSTAIGKFISENSLFKEFKKDFETFYRANNYNYVWYDKNGLVETSNALISAINEIEQQGVTAKVPYKDSLEQLLHSATDTNNVTAPDLTIELMLTGQYFFYAEKIWEGALNKKADSINWYIPKKKLSYSALLEENLKGGKIADINGPVVVEAQYLGLKKALAQYREIEKKGNEVVIPTLKGAAVIKVRDTAAIVAAVRKRLYQLGYVTSEDSGKVYDTALATTITQVKARYGLKIETAINNSFINALNVPAKKREEQIMVNMERLRWIPADTSGEFILVNIPEYALTYYENTKPAWRCGVVVGKPMTKTVIFSGDMRYVVFSPYWNVPTSIINKEIKPGMARNKNYLAKHNMEWNGGRVRQKPGPSNSLGLVKFLFPNSNNIYLHDTPSKSLFNETNRAFSHGCIRVSQPKELAVRVLRQYPEWTPAKIDAAMHAGREQYVTLKKTIPVYIGYFTAFLDNSGQVNFRTDIYQRDDRLLNILMEN